MLGWLKRDRQNSGQDNALLWISTNEKDWQKVDDSLGAGEYKNAIDRLLRESDTDVVHLFSSYPDNLESVKVALDYIGHICGVVVVAKQLPESLVAEKMGVDVEFYRECLQDPDGPVWEVG
ncbi:hypothetical protein HF670_12085 [Acidithiobacillus thiooxidans]|uniref:hypothetical protein n=1 Tax=Acidithiobacillus thiooxidans TaxID=930 RepID=UPI001C07D0A4|nr:hypothetical protein [Acidithiobacillus thiooxidans]MBU2840284.1 hypothetical protein [Acidithiobacillus thiooxidans]